MSTEVVSLNALAEQANRAHAEVEGPHGKRLQKAREAGEALTAAKAQLPHRDGAPGCVRTSAAAPARPSSTCGFIVVGWNLRQIRNALRI